MKEIVEKYLRDIRVGKKVNDILCKSEDEAREFLNYITELSEGGFRKYEVKDNFELLISYESPTLGIFAIKCSIKGWVITYSAEIVLTPVVENNPEKEIFVNSFDDLYQIVHEIESGSKKYKKA